MSFSVNVAGAQSAGRLRGIRIYEFDAEGRLMTRIQAAEARLPDGAKAGAWDIAFLAIEPLSTAQGRDILAQYRRHLQF